MNAVSDFTIVKRRSPTTVMTLEERKAKAMQDEAARLEGIRLRDHAKEFALKRRQELQRRKTIPCRNKVAVGACPYGDRCQYNHDEAAVQALARKIARSRNKSCELYWLSGDCKYGDNCYFSHIIPPNWDLFA